MIDALALLALLAGAGTDCAFALRPFEATYRVTENGKDRGQGQARLTRIGDHWRYELVSEVRRGILSGKATQSSEFTLDSGFRLHAFQTVYSAGPIKRRSIGTVDAEGRARGIHRGDEWDLEAPPGAVDRLGLNLRLAHAIACGRPVGTVPILDRGRVREFRFERQPESMQATALGDLAVIPLIRGSDQDHTTTWLAPALNHVAVRILRLDEGETRDLTITHLEFSDD